VWPLKFDTTASQVIDYTGAAALLGSLPAAEWIIADRGYVADWFRDALKDQWKRPLYPWREVARQSRSLRHAVLSTPQTHRGSVLSAEGMAQGRNLL